MGERDKKGRFVKGVIPYNKGTKGVMKVNKGSFKKGVIPWNAGTKGMTGSNNGSFEVGEDPPKHKEKCKCFRCDPNFVVSDKEKDRRIKDAHKLGISNIGRKHTKETREKISIAHRGAKAYNYTGITPLSKLLRGRSMWKIWREAVFLRDNFTCQNEDCTFCNNKIGSMLHPHHIKPVALFPELVFQIQNGITYCAEYHMKSELHVGIQKVARMER